MKSITAEVLSAYDISRFVHGPLFLVRKSDALKMIADEAIPQAEGMTAELGAGPFHRALEKIRADHAGTTDSLGGPDVKDTH